MDSSRQTLENDEEDNTNAFLGLRISANNSSRNDLEGKSTNKKISIYGQKNRRAGQDSSANDNGETNSRHNNNKRSNKQMKRNNSTEVINITSKTSLNNRTIQYDLLPEDMRISKLLRRLAAENNVKAAIEICEKLKKVVVDPCNANYINSEFEILSKSLIAVLENGPTECTSHVSELFGMMGYVVRLNFSVYKSTVVKNYKNSKKLRIPMMKALACTIKHDSSTLTLRHIATRLMELLKDLLEVAETADIFIAIVDVIVEMCRNYPASFNPYFTDIVDIVVGWHLESKQSILLKCHCSKVLQEFKEFWEEDMKFTLSLLGQFLEDLTACADELKLKVDKLTVSSVGSFVGAFNTVLKCLFTSPEVLVYRLGKEFLEDSFKKILEVAILALNDVPDYETFLAVNEHMTIVLSCLKTNLESFMPALSTIILTINGYLDCYNGKEITCFIIFLLKFINVSKNLLPVEVIDSILDPNSQLISYRLTGNQSIQQGIIQVYHEILNIKDVLLLQEAYKHILNDLTMSLNVISMTDNRKVPQTRTIKQAELCITFNLLAMSSLATSTNSIIAMWALQPSILDLLANKLKTTNFTIWSNYPTVHYAIMKLLSAHCRKNNNFISSSKLLNTNNSMTDNFNKFSLSMSPSSPTSSSPSSENFGLILQFLSDITLCQLPNHHMILILDWCIEIVTKCLSYNEILNNDSDFVNIIKNIIKHTLHSSDQLILKYAECINKLCDYDVLQNDVYTLIAEICCIQMCSVNADVREKFSYIFSKLPLRVSLKQVNEFSGLNEQRALQISELQRWHLSAVTFGDLRPQYFKSFIEKISFQKDAEFIEEFLKEIFVKCWYSENGKPMEFNDMSQKDIRCLISWIQLEAAQYCVNNKLKTAVGKPQETFLAIESIIKEDYRILALKEKSTVRNIKTLIANQKQARILLGFMEALEKSIYNAAEGTAFSIPAIEKPARNFFRVNSPTCNEWFNRNRTAVDLVALHCMEPEMVIRYSEAILKDLVSNGKTSEIFFEHTLLTLAWALLRNGENDALYGLYVWSKKVSNKKYLWIKMASDQAAGHRETATEGYLNLLHGADKLDPHIRDFIVDQTTISLLYSGRWSDLHEFLIAEEATPNCRVTTPVISITAKQIECIIQYEKTQDCNVFDLASWEVLDNGLNIGNNFSTPKIISLVENTIGNIMLGKEEFPEDMAKTCFQIIQSSLQECLRTQSKEFLNQLTILNHVCHKTILQKIVNGKCEDMRSLCVDKIYGSFTLMRLLEWSEYFADINQDHCEQQNIDIRLDMISIGRKENNLRMCKLELEKYYNKSEYAKNANLVDQLSVEKLKNILTEPESTADVTIWTENMSRAIYEQCKWMYSLPNQKEDSLKLAASASIGIMNRLEQEEFSSKLLRERSARFLLSLSEWIQTDPEIIINAAQNPDSPISTLFNKLPNLSASDENSLPSIMQLPDATAGKLIQQSVKECPHLAKAWGALGAWCYRWGRKMVEIENSSAGNLTVSDISAIKKIIPIAKDSDIDQIVNILNQHQVTTEDEDIGPNEVSSTELIENQLKGVPILESTSPDEINAIIDIWRRAHKNIYGYYEIAADAYFKYLQLETNKFSLSNADDSNGDSSVVTATLRLLRLIVKHALGLQEVLENGLASTPTSPWKVIVPQLFSRLNHHEPYVRRRVSELLCRVAKDSPHLIIFPAVVAAAQKQGTTEVSFAIGKDLHKGDQNGNSELRFCFDLLLDTLSKQAPETVNQVQLLVCELRRVTLLFDELWLISLSQVFADCNKRFAIFENDFNKHNNIHNSDKNTLFNEKYKLLLRPIIFVMERVHEISSRPPETNHERHFQEKFTKIIDETIINLKKPFDMDNPADAWNKFKAFYVQLQLRYQKRAYCTLKMSDISPVLAQLKNTTISMPGVENVDNQPVYIKVVNELVHILPTKTKPKKLVFKGSNGRNYTYLFKGLEDLHLDERIMQFLSIANQMMSKSVDCNGKSSYYRAHHYSVIPLGPRSGLISWVDGVTPIFSMYKKWQQRQAANAKTEVAVMRPSEVYYKKLTPLLQDQGLKITDNRKDWPIAILRKVLIDLSAETPRDLLSKELWCHSTTAASWRQVIRNYSLSIAVMSVIGYVIGLGDRHLDNVLIKLSTGEIVHIDYNVCFEKGKTLRVPEKVPFRITPNLEEALGVTGIEGTFRLSCEHVLKSLKKGRETLLTLLEAFVYDPLVDWAISEDGVGELAATAYGGEHMNLRQARKQLEREVTRDTLAIRFAEIKEDWYLNRDDLYQQLNHLQNYLMELEETRSNINEIESMCKTYSQQQSMIREAEALGTAIASHQLNSLSHRYKTYKIKKDEYESVSLELKRIQNESYQILSEYMVAVKNVNSNTIQEYVEELNGVLMVTKNSEFDLVKDFLDSSAQTNLNLQCEQVNKELLTYLIKQIYSVQELCNMLLQYGNIIKFYSSNNQNQHRIHKFWNWCKFLLNNPNVQSCRDVVTEFKHTFETDHSINYGKQSEQIRQYELKMQKLIESCFGILNTNSDLLNRELAASDLNKYVLVHNENIRIIQAIVEQEPRKKIAVANYLADLNKNRILMETNTQANKLDNMFSNIRYWINDFILFNNYASELSHALCNSNYKILVGNTNHLMTATNQIFKSLQDLANVFDSTILTDTICAIISEDTSVLEMISSISNIRDDLSLNDLVNNLNLHLECILRNNASPYVNCFNMGNILCEKIINLMNSYEQDETDSMGKRIFLNFATMFGSITLLHNEIIDIANKIEIPSNWMRIDQILESKELCITAFNPNAAKIIEVILMIQQLETLIEFFSNCLQIACSFRGAEVSQYYDDEFLCRPIYKYLSDYITKYLLGFGTLATAVNLCVIIEQVPDFNLDFELENSGEIICLQEILSRTVKNDHMNNPIMYTNVAQVCLNMDFTWKKKDLILQLKETCEGQMILLKRLQLLHSVYQWHHDEIIMKSGAKSVKSEFLLKLQNSIQQVTLWQTTIKKIREEMNSLTTVVQQRLKWAAGANPNLIPLLNNFEELSVTRRSKLDEEGLIVAIILKSCSSLFIYENYRLQYPDDAERKKNFSVLLTRWDKICSYPQNSHNLINAVEIALVELLDPEGPIDKMWMNNVTALIDDMNDQAQGRIAKLEKNLNSSHDNLQICAHKLRSLMDCHHKMISDIRRILKSTMKLEGDQASRIREYLIKYKQFLEVISELYSNVQSRDFTDDLVKQTLQLTITSIGVVKDIYNELISLGNGFDKENYPLERNAVQINYQEKKQFNCGDELVSSAATAGVGVPQTQKEQKRNAYAVSVWRRIRMKLEGRDPDPNKRCTVQEQVDWMIREAMDLDNLAVLYEGWTPWV